MRKYYYYVNPDGFITGPSGDALNVRGDVKVKTLVFIFPAEFDVSSSVLRVYYAPPGHTGPSLYQTLDAASVSAEGLQTAEWLIDNPYVLSPGRMSFSLAVISGDGTRWVSKKAWIPVMDSNFHADSEEDEETYLSRLETLEAAVAAIETSKQDALTFDEAPTEDSTNPVTSGGVYTSLSALEVGKQDTLTFDDAPVEDSTNPVTSGGVYSALAGKQDTLTFDNAPTADSTNPVTSNGVYDALETIKAKFEESVEVDIDAESQLNGFVTTSNLWKVGDRNLSCIIPVEDLKKIIVTPKDALHAANISLLVNNVLADDEAPTFAGDTGGRIMVSGETAQEIDVPDDCAYVLIALKGSGISITPDSVIFVYEKNIPGADDYADMVSITWSALKALRDGGNLVPGRQYRITDYVCTTTMTDTQVASHPYDIIVTADDEGTLNEQARACLHDGDTYYSDESRQCNLAAWQVWYCLDNDTDRFGWVDADNGHGVVYRLIDEWDNDVSYDFKQIQMALYEVTASTVASVDVGRLVFSVFAQRVSGVTISETKSWRYTFDTGEGADASALSERTAWGNRIGRSVDFAEDVPLACNSFIGAASENKLEDDCTDNSFGNYCSGNSFGNDCSVNSFGNYCYGNSFGNYCSGNSFGNDCSVNSFGNDCSDNSFGNDCSVNSFGNYCYGNSFGNYCYGNSFGNDCSVNSFGNDCSYNSFGNSCSYNSFGNSKNNARFIGGNVFVSFPAESTSGAVCLLSSVSGADSSSRLTIEGAGAGNGTVYYGKNSSGDIKHWNPADLVQ